METTHDEETAPTPEPEAQPEPDPTPDPEPAPAAIEPVRKDASEVVAYDHRQREILKNTIAEDLTDDELDFALIQSERAGLDLFNRQMHVWKDQGKLVMMTSIDGLRLVARRTGKYQGRTDPQWMGADGVWVDAWIQDTHPLAARVYVQHADDPAPISGLALWAEFAQYTGRGDNRRLRKMWDSKAGGKPSHMLAKVAEAIALRAAFPAELSGFYTEDEINTADELMSAQKADPDNRPSAGTEETQELMMMLADLPEEARARIEAWWENSYVPKVLQQPFGQVGPIGMGSVERFRPGSPHLAKVRELLEKAQDAVAGAGAPATAAEPGPAPRETGADQAAAPAPPPESSPAPEGATFTDLEATILDALEAIGIGTGAQIAEYHGVPDNQQFKTELAALFHKDMIELVPADQLPENRGQGRGPARIYQRNDALLAQMDEQPILTKSPGAEEAPES